MVNGIQQKKVMCDCPHASFQKVTIGKKSKRMHNKINRIISWAAGISLILAYGYGCVFNQVDFEGLIHQQLDILETKTISENTFKIHPFDNETIYVAVGTESGYGGPLVVAPVINEQGLIERILLLDNKETHSFIQKLRYRGFFDQFEGKHIKDPLIA